MTRGGRRRTADSGFTLVEILVVLSIIALLLVFFTPTLRRMIGLGAEGKAKSEVQKMKTLVAKYASNPRYGDYPPTDVKNTRLRIPTGVDLRPNDENLGIESLVLHFSHADFADQSPFTEEKFLVNTDNDAASENVTRFGKPDLFEYADPWGNPYIYFRLSDFDPKAPVPQHYVGATEDIEAEPVVSDKTGAFMGESDGFQIMSCGPDGDFGTDDDIGSWK